MNLDFSYILSLAIRSMFLGGIVFATTTYIPDNVPSIRNRLIISALVVILYALIDYIQQLLLALRRVTCKIACGCTPGDSSSESGLDLDLDALAKSADFPTTPTTTATATAGAGTLKQPAVQCGK